MAGSDPRFDPDRFRDAIKFAMRMGAPEDETKRVTFRWNKVASYNNADPAGRPYAWDSTPVAEFDHPDVLIDCAVDFSARPAGTRDTPIGQFDTSTIAITVLDSDIETISGADLVVIDGDTYEIKFIGPPTGLFDVTIFTIYAEARDES